MIRVSVPADKLVIVTENHGGYLGGTCVVCDASGWLSGDNTPRYGLPYGYKGKLHGLTHSRTCEMNTVLDENGCLREVATKNAPLATQADPSRKALKFLTDALEEASSRCDITGGLELALYKAKTALAQSPTTHGEGMREASQAVLASGMSRATTRPGGATSEHDYKIPSYSVWAFDKACKELERASPQSPAPRGEGVSQIDIRQIAYDAMQRMWKAGESYEMCARWISEDYHKALATPTPSDRAGREEEIALAVVAKISDGSIGFCSNKTEAATIIAAALRQSASAGIERAAECLEALADEMTKPHPTDRNGERLIARINLEQGYRASAKALRSLASASRE